MNVEEKNRETVKMVENAMGVLDILKHCREAMTVDEISDACRLNHASVERILYTLEYTEWVKQLPGERYTAGNKLQPIANRKHFYKALSDVSGQILPEYVDRFQIPMNVMVIEGSVCEIIQQIRTNALINYVPPIYSKLPFYSCAGGKVLLSDVSENMISDLFKYSQIIPLTDKTICNEEDFRKELEEVQKNGYAIDFHEVLDQGSCIAVPIRNQERTIIASVSFSGITNIANKKELNQYIPALLEVSNLISQRLYRKAEV